MFSDFLTDHQDQHRQFRTVFWASTSDSTWYLLPGCRTSENRRHRSTSLDCSKPTGLIDHYDSLVHSGLLLEDSLQKAALWQLVTLHGEMARYTNLPLSHPENRKDGDKESKISQLKHGVETEEKVKDVFLFLFSFFWERRSGRVFWKGVCFEWEPIMSYCGSISDCFFLLSKWLFL